MTENPIFHHIASREPFLKIFGAVLLVPRSNHKSQENHSPVSTAIYLRASRVRPQRQIPYRRQFLWAHGSLEPVKTYCDIPCWLVLCIYDLSVINYHGIPPSPICPTRPANALRKSYASVGHEQLIPISERHGSSMLGSELTILSCLMPLAFPQALITQASFIAITITTSTPLPLISSKCSM